MGRRCDYRHIVGRGRHGNLDNALRRDNRVDELSAVKGARGRGVETWAGKGADERAVEKQTRHDWLPRGYAHAPTRSVEVCFACSCAWGVRSRVESWFAGMHAWRQQRRRRLRARTLTF
jgi:hypothetical protein